MADQELSAAAAAEPGPATRRPTFGLSRERVKRVELVLAMRGGGVISVVEELADEITAEGLEAYASELTRQIKQGQDRSFVDSTSPNNQRSWVNLGEVTAFTVKQAK